jgi:hypothetical protein
MTILGFLANNALTVGTGLAVLALLIVASSTWIIRENESGLVIKKYGPPLAAGRLVALDGEAGY